MFAFTSEPLATVVKIAPDGACARSGAERAAAQRIPGISARTRVVIRFSGGVSSGLPGVKGPLPQHACPRRRPRLPIIVHRAGRVSARGVFRFGLWEDSGSGAVVADHHDGDVVA